MSSLCRRTAPPVVAIVLSAGLAACSGGSHSPKVANLNNASSSASTTTLPSGTAVQLLDQWAACIRSHGLPNQTDPVITASGSIQITLPNNSMNTYQNISADCQPYLTAASRKLGGGTTANHPSAAKLLDYSHCMQQNGVPDFPDPSNGGLRVQVSPGSDLDPSSPTFQSASKTCAKKTGVQGFGTGNPNDAPAGSVSISSSGGPGPGSAGGPGAGSGGSSGMVINGSGSGSPG